MVLTGSCPWPGPWSRTHGAHLHLQAREDPYSNGDGGPVHFSHDPAHGRSPRANRPCRAAAWRRAPALHAAAPDARLAMRGPLLAAMPLAGASRRRGFLAIARTRPIPRPLIGGCCGRKGCRIALPRVVAARKAPARFHLWAGRNPGPRRLRACSSRRRTGRRPSPTSSLVPLLAFDAQRASAGLWRGLYDRTLAALRASGNVLAVGFGFAGQEIADFRVARATKALDWIVTETGCRSLKVSDAHSLYRRHRRQAGTRGAGRRAAGPARALCASISSSPMARTPPAASASRATSPMSCSRLGRRRADHRQSLARPAARS